METSQLKKFPKFPNIIVSKVNSNTLIGQAYSRFHFDFESRGREL